MPYKYSFDHEPYVLYMWYFQQDHSHKDHINHHLYVLFPLRLEFGMSKHLKHYSGFQNGMVLYEVFDVAHDHYAVAPQQAGRARTWRANEATDSTAGQIPDGASPSSTS